MFTRFSKRLVSSISLLLAASMLFTDVAGVYADELSSNDTVIESVLDSVEETEELSAETEAYDAAYLAKDAVGSDGVAYEGVNYISNRTFLALPEDSQEAYLRACEDIADMYAHDMRAEDVVIAADTNGDIYFHAYVPMNYIAETQNEMVETFLADVSANVLSLSDVSFNDVSENDVEDPEAEDVSDNDTVLDVSDNDTENDDESASEDISLNDVSENEADDDSLTSENMDFFEDFGVLDDETIELEEGEEFAPEAYEYDTLLSYKGQGNYFSNQLNKYSKVAFNAAKKAMVDQGKTSFTFNGPLIFGSEFSSAFSALVTQNTVKLSWIGEGYSYSYRWSYGSYTYNMTMKKSRYYNKTLHSDANKKVKELVSQAFASAASKGDITYGVIEYLDDWFCRNNKYDHDVADGRVASTTAEFYYCHSQYGCLLKTYGVCESYAKALSWCLDYAGITNIYAVSADHAYVYVQMPFGADGKNHWYLVDSTWNDPDSGSSASSKQYLLKENPTDYHHQSTGAVFNSSQKFKYPKIEANYTQKTVTLNKSNFALAKGKSTTLSLNNSKYYAKYPNKSWESSDKTVASVSKSGKVSGKKAGSATITYHIAGAQRRANVTVYDLKNVVFNENSKTSLNKTFADPDAVLSGTESDNTIKLTVNQTTPSGLSAGQLASLESGPKLSATSSNKKVATVGATLSGNTITLSIKPIKVGKTTITVKFGNKSAKLTYNVKYSISAKAAWFDFSKIKNETYSGKAFTPKVSKSAQMPKGVTYKVTYSNNKNAGTATVTVTGTKNYTGTVSRTFTISRLNIAGLANVNGKKPAEAKIKAKTYNGNAQNASITVKYKGKTLKKDKDYTVSYNASPVRVGTYNVSITGIGNYSGNIASGLSFTINQVKAKNLKVSVTASRKYTGVSNPPTVTVKAGNGVLTEGIDYTVSYKMKKTGVAYTKPLDVGTYEVTITYKGTNIDTTGKASVTKTYKITEPKKKKK